MILPTKIAQELCRWMLLACTMMYFGQPALASSNEAKRVQQTIESAEPQPLGGPWIAGSYSYSDEMGGFRILDVSGAGTVNDPVVLVQEFLEARPVTLVIRAISIIEPFGMANLYANGFLHMRLVTLNQSGIGWTAFDLELQEELSEPSTYGDGLSFDQRKTASTYVASDRFARFDQDFEPFDRLSFAQGQVDPFGRATFGFLITDFTPRDRFFLVQDPKVPAF